MNNGIFFFILSILFALIESARRAPDDAIGIDVIAYSLVKSGFDSLPSRRARDVPHVVPLPIHSRIRITGNDRVISLGSRGTFQGSTLEYRLISQIFAWSLDQIVQCPIGHPLQINILGRLALS